MKSMIIRSITHTDIPQLPKLFGDLGYPSDNESVQHRMYKLMNHPDYSFLVLEKDNKIIGFCGMCKMMFIELDGTYMRILAFVIDNAYQNQGFGKQLLYAAEIHAKNLNCDVITLNSGNRLEREAAHQFYLKNGYSIKTSGFVKKI